MKNKTTWETRLPNGIVTSCWKAKDEKKARLYASRYNVSLWRVDAIAPGVWKNTLIHE